jgi:pyrroloquinoline quinone biosynthesis protein B
VEVRLLGTAAGGGFPQWNCACRNCQAARAGGARASSRTQGCVAVSGDGRRWFLVGASPDVRSQVETLPVPDTGGAVRRSALAGVLLASADLDHVLGLLSLREGERLLVHATPAVRRAVCEGLSMGKVLSAYCGVSWAEPPPTPRPLAGHDGRPSGVLYQAFPVPGRPPRYRAAVAEPDPEDVVGYLFTDPRTGGRLAVVPGVGALDDGLLDTLSRCDALLIDGTFWSEHELRDAGVDAPSASAMGHLPVGGPGGSLRRVAGLPAHTKIYIHINNSNPMLLDDSPERRDVEGAGVVVGLDGMRLTL